MLDDKEEINRMHAAVVLENIMGNKYEFKQDCPWNCKDECGVEDLAKTDYYCGTGECCINLKNSAYVSCKMWEQVDNTGVITILKNVTCSSDSDCTKTYFNSFCESTQDRYAAACLERSDFEYFCKEGLCMQPCSL